MWARVWFLRSWCRGKNKEEKQGWVLCVCLHANILFPGFNMRLLGFISLSIEPESSKHKFFCKSSVPHAQGSLTPQPGPAEWDDLWTILCPIVFSSWFLLWLSYVTSSHLKVYGNLRLTLVNPDLRWFFSSQACDKVKNGWQDSVNHQISERQTAHCWVSLI